MSTNAGAGARRRATMPIMTRASALFVGASAGAILLAGIGTTLTTCCGTNGSWAVDALGVQNAVALARLRVVQPYETIGSVTLLGALFWLAYRPAAPGTDRALRPRSARRLIAWFTLLVTAALLATAYSHYFSGEVSADEIAIE